MVKYSRNLTPDQMIKIALKAMTEAAKDYSNNWTKTFLPPWWVDESVYTTAIGRALHSAAPGGVLYEHSVRKIVKHAAVKEKKPSYKGISPSSRADITVFQLWASAAKPLFCIEVKNNGFNNKAAILEDIERCQRIVDQGGSVKEAAMIFLLNHGGRTNRLKDAFENGWVWGENKKTVFGLGKNGELTRLYSKLARHQKYQYDEKHQWNEFPYPEHKGSYEWAAVAVRIQKHPRKGG